MSNSTADDSELPHDDHPRQPTVFHAAASANGCIPAEWDLGDSERLFGSLLRDYVSTVLLVNFAHGSSLDADLSRHAILHGADADYGTRRNAMKSIILFDYVQSVLAYNAKSSP
jgi:hypothetical protein